MTDNLKDGVSVVPDFRHDRHVFATDARSQSKTITGSGCVVDCVISGGDVTNAGMVVGLWNGTSSAVTLGPLEVSGTVNGAPASAANLCGTTNAAGVHVINATIK